MIWKQDENKKREFSDFDQTKGEEQTLKINGTICAFDSRTNTFLMPLSDDIIQGDVIPLDVEFAKKADNIMIDSTEYSAVTDIEVSFEKKIWADSY